MSNQRVIRAYEKSQKILPYFRFQLGDPPLIFEDSVSPAPSYPFCTLGVLSAEGEWGTQKGIAFVVQDNYLLTCASNCYSHEHGQYSNITITIDSHRKTGHDVHKITKVFIPEQYKQLPQNERKEHNYALLYIQGQPKLKDRYGNLSISFRRSDKVAYFECSINAQDELLFKSFKKQNRIECSSPNGCPSGGPIVFRQAYGYRDVNGLIAKENITSQPYMMLFSDHMEDQINLWIKTEKGVIKMIQLTDINFEQLGQSFKETKPKPVQQILMLHSRLKAIQYQQLFQILPVSSVSNLKCGSNQMGDDLSFLKMGKFKDLKLLDLTDNRIGPLGCKSIAEAFLSNLKNFDLSENPIGNQGCEFLSKAHWPFLQRLQLHRCEFDNKGLGHLCRLKRQNLTKLLLGDNAIGNSLSETVEKTDIPIVQQLQIANCSLTDGEGLMFLRSSCWRSLKQLTLYNNNIGSKGCKMIKQSNLTLRSLDMTTCRINGAGLKWLCKADLSKMSYFLLGHIFSENNDFGNSGCSHLSKASMPQLKSIELKNTNVSVQGLKWLIRTKWDDGVLLCLFGMFNTGLQGSIGSNTMSLLKGRVNDQKLRMFQQ